MRTNPRSRQLPGRAEALRQVLAAGISNSSQELRHLAGFDVQYRPMTSGQPHGLPMPMEVLDEGSADYGSGLPF